MAFVKLQYSKSQVNKAGDILIDPGSYSDKDQGWATEVLANWRACHLYPINTFQATLRTKLKTIDSSAIVAQRLKRAPSIVLKLVRFSGMKLARMQDIGGLRAVVASVSNLNKLEHDYRNAKFKHALVSSDNYVANPKKDGYRSIHLIYRYKSSRASDYDGLTLELQLRTRLQHAWATAVETMGTFLGTALKSGLGDEEWRKFFSNAGAAIAIVEKTTPVPGYEGKEDKEVFNELASAESRLRVLEKLEGFAIAADKIKAESGRGTFHLIVLNSEDRTVSIRPYSTTQLEQANIDYAEIEKRTQNGERIEAVLVSAGPIDALKNAYPNYFLDTQEFVTQIKKLITPKRF